MKFVNPFTSLTTTNGVHSQLKKKIVPFTSAELFDVVIDVAQYKHFLPWTVNSSVTHSPYDKNRFQGQLEIGYGVFNEKYSSAVQYQRPKRIEVIAADSKMFRVLNNIWAFQDIINSQSSTVEFTLEFEFRSPLYQRAATMFISEILNTTLDAMVAEAHRRKTARAGKLEKGQTPWVKFSNCNVELNKSLGEAGALRIPHSFQEIKRADRHPR